MAQEIFHLQVPGLGQDVSLLVSTAVIGAALGIFLFGLLKFIRAPRFPRDEAGKLLRYPFSKSLPLLQQTVYVALNDYRQLDVLMEFVQEAGPLRTFFFKVWGHKPYVVVTDPAIVTYVTRTKYENFQRGPVWVNLFGHLLGRNLFTIDGPQWLAERKIYQQVLQHQNIKNGAMAALAQKTDELLVALGKFADAGATIDMEEVGKRFTLDVIGLFACGYDLKTLSYDQGAEHFMEAFEYMTVFGRWHFVLPFELHPFVRLCTPYGWKYLHGRQLLRDYAMNLLQQRKKEDEATWATRTDIVSIFLSRKDDDGKPFTDVFLRDAILLMFFAGRDTTGVAMHWAVFCMYTNRDVLEKARKEIKEVLGKENPSSSDYTYDNVGQLKYLEAVVYEVLRLYPSAPIFMREAVEDDTLPDGTKVYANTSVLMSPFIMARLPEIWEDPLKFNPDRYMGERPSAFKHMAFLAGPHMCIGAQLAVLQLKIALARLITNFEFELTRPLEEHEPVQNSFMIQMKGGFPCKPRRL